MNRELAVLMAAQPADDLRCRRFALACVQRVRHLLESADVIAQLEVLQAFVDGRLDRAALNHAAVLAADLATRQRGSSSIDGTAHAAVSATHAVAKALAGRAAEAADYAAYAAVYAYASHAVTDPEAFAGEYAWQIETWQGLANPG
jgi:hypothetical protein